MTVGVGSITKIMAGECPYREWKDRREPNANLVDGAITMMIVAQNMGICGLSKASRSLAQLPRHSP